MFAKRLILSILILGAIAAAAPAQAWRDDIEYALKQQKSYDFRDIATGDVIRTLGQDANVNIVVDSGVPGSVASQKITLIVNDMSIGDALTWTARLAGLEWVIENEAVFITTPERLTEDEKSEINSRNAAWRVPKDLYWIADMQAALEKPLSVQYSQKPFSDVIMSLRIFMNVNVILASDADGSTPVTLDVTKMSAASLLSWIARKTGTDYAVCNDAIYFAKPAEIEPLRRAGIDFSPQGKAQDIVTFDFTDKPLDEALKSLGEDIGVSVIVKTTVSPMPRVTLAAKDMSFRAALLALTNKTGLNNSIVPLDQSVIVTLTEPCPAPPKPAKAAPAAPAMAVTSATPTTSVAPAKPAPIAISVLPAPAAATPSEEVTPSGAASPAAATPSEEVTPSGAAAAPAAATPAEAMTVPVYVSPSETLTPGTCVTPVETVAATPQSGSASSIELLAPAVVTPDQK